MKRFFLGLEVATVVLGSTVLPVNAQFYSGSRSTLYSLGGLWGTNINPNCANPKFFNQHNGSNDTCGPVSPTAFILVNGQLVISGGVNLNEGWNIDSEGRVLAPRSAYGNNEYGYSTIPSTPQERVDTNVSGCVFRNNQTDVSFPLTIFGGTAQIRSSTQNGENGCINQQRRNYAIPFWIRDSLKYPL